MSFSDSRPPSCTGCVHYHGVTYGGNRLICAFHPYGWDGEGPCVDSERYVLNEGYLKEMATLTETLRHHHFAHPREVANPAARSFRAPFSRLNFLSPIDRPTSQALVEEIRLAVRRIVSQCSPDFIQNISAALSAAIESKESAPTPDDPYQACVDFLRDRYQVKHGIARIRVDNFLQRYNFTPLETYRLLNSRKVQYVHGSLIPAKGLMSRKVNGGGNHPARNFDSRY